jgi:hypothetical protein
MGLQMKYATRPPTGIAMSTISPWHFEPSLDEILSDAITVAVMQADRVDPAKLAAELRRLAARAGAALNRSRNVA